MRAIVRPERRLSEAETNPYPGLHSSRRVADSLGTGGLASRKLTDEEVALIGSDRNFLGVDGLRMYRRVPANRGSQLRRIGATDHCIVCGMPALPGVTAFAHIHMRDLHLSPCHDPTRVFCLCWHHHHGCYDQGYLSTLELLQAEAIWIENKRRPQPHPRDIALMQRVKQSGAVRHCVWTEKRAVRRATFHPGYLMQLMPF